MFDRDDNVSARIHAAIGATAGAGGGTAAVMAGDRKEATLAIGTPMTVRIVSPVTVTIEKN